MARKKLYGAALAAHNRKLSRTGGGGSRAIVRSGGGGKSITVRVAAPKPAKKKHGKRRGGGGGRTSLKERGWPTGMAMLWGWLKTNKPDMMAELSKLPATDTLGLEAVLGLIEHGILEYTNWVPAGTIRKAVDADATAKLVLAGYAFGHSGFTSAVVAGDDGASGFVDVE